MADVTLIIDGQTVTAPEGQKLLWAAEAAGFDIPHLCSHPDQEPPFGACRLCYVEIEGRKSPVTACTEPVREGLVVHTRSERVDRLVRSGFQLLLSTHDLSCKTCPGKHHCGLRRTARLRKIGLRSGDLERVPPRYEVDESHPRIGLNPNRCILCGLCVWMCDEVVGRGILHFSGRGMRTRISTFDDQPLATHAADCADCDRCATICPVGALYLKPEPAEG
jgi:formate dehydrogenase major subunit/NADH-quinone oxidoreductase subunit G